MIWYDLWRIMRILWSAWTAFMRIIWSGKFGSCRSCDPQEPQNVGLKPKLDFFWYFAFRRCLWKHIVENRPYTQSYGLLSSFYTRFHLILPNSDNFTRSVHYEFHDFLSFWALVKPVQKGKNLNLKDFVLAFFVKITKDQDIQTS